MILGKYKIPGLGSVLLIKVAGSKSNERKYIAYALTGIDLIKQ